MGVPRAGVLFVGEYPGLSTSVTRVLNSLGYERRFAASCEDALAALETRKYRVVLSKSKLPDGNARKLIPMLQAASGWLYLSFPVEDGCWWIPMMQDGELCMESVALHSREFSKSLIRIVKALHPAAADQTDEERGASVAEPRRRSAYAGGVY